MKIVYYDSEIVDSTYLYVLTVKMSFIPYLYKKKKIRLGTWAQKKIKIN